MEQIDARRALELLIDVVDQYGEDVVYQKVPLDRNNGVGCRYEYEGNPSCLVGHVLVKAGADLSVLKGLDVIGAPADKIYTLVGGVDPAASRVLQAAQDIQDRGDSWGEALDEARAKYELIKSREMQQ